MFGGDLGPTYFYIVIGAIGYALATMMLSWLRDGWAHVKRALPRYALALPISLVISTILYVGYYVLAATLIWRLKR